MDGSQSGVFVLSTPSITLTFTSISFTLNSLNYPLFYQTAGDLNLTVEFILTYGIEDQLFFFEINKWLSR